MWLTILFWEWPPVRVAFFCFCLILLDLWIKVNKWDKEDKEEERRKQEKRERLRKLKRGQHLYIYNEPWYQEMQGIEVEREASPPNSSQDSVDSNVLTETEEENFNPKRKRRRVLNKLVLIYECRCLYKESVKLVVKTRGEVNTDMKGRNKNPKRPKYHKRD